MSKDLHDGYDDTIRCDGGKCKTLTGKCLILCNPIRFMQAELSEIACSKQENAKGYNMQSRKGKRFPSIWMDGMNQMNLTKFELNESVLGEHKGNPFYT